jgi:hypothetical protein
MAITDSIIKDLEKKLFIVDWWLGNNVEVLVLLPGEQKFAFFGLW